MTGPTISDIDKWLFESMEGNLSPAQEALLEDFLIQNPAFLEEQEMWSEATVSKEEFVYPNTSALIQKPFWARPVFFVPAASVVLAGLFTFSFFGTAETRIDSAVKTFEWMPNMTQQTATFTQSVRSNEANRAEGKSIETNTIDNNDSANVSNETASNTANTFVPNKAISTKESSKIAQVTKAKSNVTTPVASNEKKTNGKKVSNSETASGQSELKSSSTIDVVETKNIDREANSNGSTQVVETSKEGSVANSINVSKDNSETVNSAKEKELKAAAASNKMKGAEQMPLALELTLLTKEPDYLYSEDVEHSKVPVSLGDKNAIDHKRISSNYNNSMSARMKSFGRSVIRMMDNPIALQNSKDMYFHVPNMQATDANFASVGGMMGPRIQTISRAQYLEQDNEQFMNELSFDTYIRSLRGGIGVQMNHQYYKDGSYQVGQFALSYSPKFSVNKNVLIEPAVRIKVGNKSLATSKLTPGQMIEMDRQNAQVFFPEGSEKVGSNLWYKDIGFGLMSNTKWFFAGVQVDNVGKHFDNVYNNNIAGGRRAGLHYTATVGTDYVSRNKNISFSPYFLYQKMENLSEIWGGSIFRYKKFTVGGGISSYGDYAGSIGVKTNRFMMTYNADLTTSALFSQRLLSHQLTLRLLINNGQNGQRMLKL